MHYKHAGVFAVLLTLPVIVLADDAPPAGEYKAPPGIGAFLGGMFSPKAIVRGAAGAGVSQATNTPSEWGQGGEGFGKRMANAFGKHVINYTIHYAVARARHEAWGFQPSGKQGFGPRFKYALLSVVITHKTTTGKSTIAAGELAGAFGSGLISRAWQPASTHTLAAGFASGGITLGADAGMHVIREFWPEIRHPHRKHVPAAPSAAQAALVTEEVPAPEEALAPEKPND
jgi:hypothetical protein